MSKLFKLKKFFTIEEAAKYLSDSFNEPVPLSELYRLIHDNELAVSVRLFNQAYAIVGRIITTQDFDGDWYQVDADLATAEPLDKPYCIHLDDALPINDNEWFVFRETVEVIDGLWDLTMIGMESLDIEKLYQKEVGGSEPVVADAIGVYLKQGERICRLQSIIPPEATEENLMAMERRLKWILEPKGISINHFLERADDHLYGDLTESEVEEISFLFESMRNQHNGSENYEDSLSLDAHSHQLVIRASELTRFVQALQDEPPAPQHDQKPLGSKERTTLLRLIRAFCKVQGIDLNKRGVVKELEWITDEAEDTLSDETLRKIINKINDLTC